MKAKHDLLTRRKNEAVQQLEDNEADVRKVPARFHEVLQTAPADSQKTLLQTIVKQISVRKGQKKLEATN